MSIVEDEHIKCSMCYTPIDLRRAKSVLETRQLKSHEVFQCPQCGYYVAIHRRLAPAAQ